MDVNTIDIVKDALLIVVNSGFGAAIAKYAITFLKDKQKRGLAKEAVEFAEETYKALGGPKKFEKAVDYFVKHLPKRTQKKITSDRVEGLIQAAVNELRAEGGKIAADVDAGKSDADVVNDAVTDVAKKAAPAVDKATDAAKGAAVDAAGKVAAKAGANEATQKVVESTAKTVADVSIDQLKDLIAKAVAAAVVSKQPKTSTTAKQQPSMATKDTTSTIAAKVIAATKDTPKHA